MSARVIFLIVIIIFIKLSSGCKNYGDYTYTVKYYEDLIKTETNQSFYYKLPSNANRYKPKTKRVYDYGQVDFIIVGAGPTGSVIGNRLSEIKGWKVLVLEAGVSLNKFGEIPGMYMHLVNSQFNWNYQTVPQKNACLGMNDQRCAIIRGKVLGGTSAINGLVYARGSKEDFDRWASQGNDGWSYDDVLPYYIKSENCQVDGDPNYHGKGGYWNVKSRQGDTGPQFSAFVKAHKEILNYTLNNDYNGKNQLGISPIQFNIIRNKRQDVGNAFLKSIVDQRKNVKILEKAFVTKILVNRLNKKAYGVEFTHKGKLYHVKSRKEVILSAGAISSPKILTLSGIGPSEELNKLNISLVQDLPVGKILIEPPIFYGLFVQTNYSAPQKSVRQHIEDYLANAGLYVVPGNGEGISYYKSSYINIEGYPDIEIKFIASPSISANEKQIFNIKDETFNVLWSKIDLQSVFSVYCVLLQPKSVGSLKLANSNPYKYPLIDLNMYDDPQDIEVMYETIQLFKKLLTASAMKAINASIIYPDYPECKMYLTGSKDYWICSFKLLTTSSYAASSTCRMGKYPSESVVNNKLQVHGVRNLRVADLSIFPDPVSASPTATAVMIGEKVSDLIKIAHNKKIQKIDNIFGKYS